jgi:hypothetical protein
MQKVSSFLLVDVIIAFTSFAILYWGFDIEVKGCLIAAAFIVLAAFLAEYLDAKFFSAKNN